MIIGKQLSERLRDEMRKNPLEPDEARRIGGMGGLYITLEETKLDPKIYTWLYKLEFDGVCYTIYSKLLAAKSA